MKKFLLLISLVFLSLAPVACGRKTAAVQRYFLVNADVGVYNYPYLNELFGPQSGKEIAVGNAVLIYVFSRPMEIFEKALKKHFRMAEEYDIPLLVQFDPFTFWSDVPELWNWWDPDKPGYNPENKENVEWYGWSSDCAVKLGWLNWGRQLRILPMANVYAPAYQKALKERMARFMTWIREWRDSLPEDRQYLFAGVKMTGELTFGVNNWYYAGGNDLFDLPEADDPQTGITVKALPDRGVAQTGYAALKYSGIKTEGEVTAEDIFELEKRFAGFMGELAQGYGIPRGLIYSHASGAAGDLASPIQGTTCPSWSFYHAEAVNPQDSPQYKEYLPLSDAPNWAVSEWNFFNPDQEVWERALRNCYSLPGCRFVTVYNYDSVFGIDPEGRLKVLDGPVNAIRALQDGTLLSQEE